MKVFSFHCVLYYTFVSRENKKKKASFFKFSKFWWRYLYHSFFGATNTSLKAKKWRFIFRRYRWVFCSLDKTLCSTISYYHRLSPSCAKPPRKNGKSNLGLVSVQSTENSLWTWNWTVISTTCGDSAITWLSKYQSSLPNKTSIQKCFQTVPSVETPSCCWFSIIHHLTVALLGAGAEWNSKDQSPSPISQAFIYL